MPQQRWMYSKGTAKNICISHDRRNYPFLHRNIPHTTALIKAYVIFSLSLSFVERNIWGFHMQNSRATTNNKKNDGGWCTWRELKLLQIHTLIHNPHIYIGDLTQADSLANPMRNYITETDTFHVWIQLIQFKWI